jgi:glycosyltransferase involved in cell wall biosynthesis
MIINKISIIVPAYNEESTINIIADKLLNLYLVNNIKKEIIIINDCSTDNTEQLIQKIIESNPAAEIKYIKHEKNSGKGAAIHSGIKNATGDYLIIQDADLEYDPSEINKLLKPILDGYADVVYGSRFIGGAPHRILFFWHTIGNKFLTFLSNAMTNLSPELKPRPRQGRNLNTYTPLTDSNVKYAAQLWVSNQASAASMYGLVDSWDLSQVTSLANVWCGWDATSCGSAYVAMQSFNGAISMWDVSKVTTMYYTFLKASAFNGDISKWDVGRVITMEVSKS